MSRLTRSPREFAVLSAAAFGRYLVSAFATVALLVSAGIDSANAAVIDFGGLTGTTSYTEDGFSLTSNASMFVSNFGDIAPSMFPSTTSGVITLSQVGGGPFDLFSIDIRELNGSVGAQTVAFVGNLAGGGTVSQTITTDGICCNGFAANDYETFGFAPSFSNLSSVVWDQVGPTAFVTYDNFVVNAVPEPSTALLLFSGLAGIAYRRRRL